MLAMAATIGATNPAMAADGRPAFDRAAWKADVATIKAGLAQGYANLDWQVSNRYLQLARAGAQIDAMLDKASSDVDAALIVAKLVDAFRDPHLQLQLGPPPEAATLLPYRSDVDSPAPTTDSCEANRYADGKAAGRLPYTSAPGWKAVSNEPFAAGTIGDVGIIRIPAFGEDRYRSACRKVARPDLDARALRLATRAELNRQLITLIANLKSHGMTKLVVDVSGNGGGTEWSSEVAAMLTTGTLKRRAPMRVGPTCDRSAIWKGEKVCSIYAAAAEIDTMQGTGAWTGPLAVLVDRRSASATEEFVTWLKDNDRAVIAGERTFGAGCGYVDGGSAIALKAAPLHIMVPNCSRYTREGINEIEGIAPNVAVDWPATTAADMPHLLRKLFEHKSDR
jgi:hypothetical protein